MIVVYSSRFTRLYKKLSADIQEKAESRETMFRADPFAFLLKTHKLSGSLSDCWAFSIDFRYRIIFTFNDDQTEATFHAIGDHEIYD